MSEALTLNDAPAVAPEQPKRKRGKGVPFTGERARAASAKGLAALRAKRAAAEEIARLVALTPQKLAAERAELCAEEIKRTHATLMSEELTPKDRAQLLVALDRLLERERILRGIPNPGSYRPTKPRGSQESGDAEPA